MKSVRLELLNHVRVKDVEELQWYLDEFKRYYNDFRADQAVDGFTPAECGRDAPLAEVIPIEEIKRRKLVHHSFAHGILNAYELMNDEQIDEESVAA